MTFKTKLGTLGIASVLGAGLFVGTTEAEAAVTPLWEVRTVDQVKEDLTDVGGEQAYVVKWGDTLGVIADALDIDMNTLAQVNDISNEDKIIVDSRISFSKDEQVITFEDEKNEVESYDISEPEQVEEVVEEEPVYTEPVEEVYTERVEEEPVEEEFVEEVYTEPVYTEPVSSNSEQEAKEQIAFKESTDNYYAKNGRYIGKFQLDYTYLGGDYSPANQEKVAEEYVASRYGSWNEALEHHEIHNWY